MASIFSRWSAVRSLAAAAALALACNLALAQVGMTQLDVAGLPVTLVYPTAQAGRLQPFGPFEMDVALGAAPNASARRLVVMSHGTGGSTLADHDLAATLARAGFVVAQPLHVADNYLDSSAAGPVSWQTRPREVSQVIDALAGHPTWKALLQLDKVGLHGMSAGGGTALALAGARWRVLDLVRHCLEHGEQDIGFCYYGQTDPAVQAARRTSYERARSVPEQWLPAELTVEHGGRAVNAGNNDPRPDPRIAAVTLAVPVAALFSTASLAGIRIPVGVVSAGRDSLLLPAFHSQRVLQACGTCVLLADLPGAGHFDLLSPWPAPVASSVGALQPRGGQPEPGFDGAQREAAFRQIAAFFQRELGR